jgi:predicted enzyme related to lactoylglutathione lyase
MATGTYVIDYIEFSSPGENGVPTRRFFEAAFGWQFVDYGPSYHVTHPGIDAGIQGEAAQAGAGTLVVIRTADLDAAQAAVEGAGGEITRPQFDFPGGRRFHFREPGGNEMAVWMEKAP